MGFYEFLLLLGSFLRRARWSWFEPQFKIKSVIGEKRKKKTRYLAYGII
jgi:hypothetical protein